jgi:2-dehydropantoate 2-reductase
LTGHGHQPSRNRVSKNPGINLKLQRQKAKSLEGWTKTPRGRNLAKLCDDDRIWLAMKILVTGAGIIGTIYGWALAQAGHDVVHFVRPGKAVRFRNGVPMDVYDRRKGHGRYFRGKYAIKVTEAASPFDRYDLVIVPTKHFQLDDALKQLVPVAGEADFLLLTQNWRGTDAVDAILPRGRYVYGDAKAGGTFSSGMLISTLASVDLGPPEGAVMPPAMKIAAVLQSASIPTVQHEEMLRYLWVQYAITGGLWPALVRAGSMEAVLRDRQASLLAMKAVRECLEVVSRRGVDLQDYPETKVFLASSWLRRRFGVWVFKLMLRFNEFVKRSSAHALQDPTEIKVFYDDLTSTGRQLGVPMPVMDGYAEDIARFVGSH